MKILVKMKILAVILTGAICAISIGTIIWVPGMLGEFTMDIFDPRGIYDNFEYYCAGLIFIGSFGSLVLLAKIYACVYSWLRRSHWHWRIK